MYFTDLIRMYNLHNNKTWFTNFITTFLTVILLIISLFFSSRLICYDFVSSLTLEDFISKKGTVLNFDAVCAIACDVISAIERLQDLGILHNNITASNILIEQISRVS